MEAHGVHPMATTGGGSYHNGSLDGAALVQLLQHASLSRPQPQQQNPSSNSALMANLGAFLSNISQGGNNALQPNAPVSLAPIHAPISQSLAIPGQPGSSSSEAAHISSLIQQLFQRPVAQPPVQLSTQSTTLDTLAGTLSDDEAILVNTLSTRKLKGRNVREALEALHGVNNHTAGSWKDYFLSDYDNLSKRISSDGGAAAQPDLVPKEERVISRGRPKGESSARRRSSSRGRSHSRTEQHARFSATPSRSPTPPPSASTITAGPGRKFTDAEDEYFLKSVKWQLKQDPYVSGNQIARVLAEKAPGCGRSLQSWRGHMTTKYKDEIALLTAKARIKDEEKRQRESQTYKSSTVPSSASASTSSKTARRGKQAHPPPSADEEDPDTDDDIANMAPKGQPMSGADYRVAARYIASRPDWDAITSNLARWGAFAQQYPQRSDKAWAQLYVLHHAAIDPLVPKYRERYEKRTRTGSSQQNGPEIIPKIVLPPYHRSAKRARAEPDSDYEDPEYSERGKRSRGSY